MYYSIKLLYKQFGDTFKKQKGNLTNWQLSEWSRGQKPEWKPTAEKALQTYHSQDWPLHFWLMFLVVWTSWLLHKTLTHGVISHLTRQLLLPLSQASLLSSRYISWYTNVMILIRTVVISFFNSILILNYPLVNFHSKIIALINYRKVYSILEQQCYCRHFH